MELPSGRGNGCESVTQTRGKCNHGKCYVALPVLISRQSAGGLREGFSEKGMFEDER